MISKAVISRFGLVLQDKKSPDGFLLYIAENLSHNKPTIFFELVTNNDSSAADSNKTSIRITKAGAINNMVVSQNDLENKSFTELQQAIEKTLHIPE